MQPQPADWLDGRADTPSPILIQVSRDMAELTTCLCYAVRECRHVVSNVLKLETDGNAIALTPVRHKRDIKFLITTPNFMGY